MVEPVETDFVVPLPDLLAHVGRRYTTAMAHLGRILAEEGVTDVLEVDSIRAMELTAELQQRMRAEPAGEGTDFGAGLRLLEVVHRALVPLETVVEAGQEES